MNGLGQEEPPQRDYLILFTTHISPWQHISGGGQIGRRLPWCHSELATSVTGGGELAPVDCLLLFISESQVQQHAVFQATWSLPWIVLARGSPFKALHVVKLLTMSSMLWNFYTEGLYFLPRRPLATFKQNIKAGSSSWCKTRGGGGGETTWSNEKSVTCEGETHFSLGKKKISLSCMRTSISHE